MNDEPHRDPILDCMVPIGRSQGHLPECFSLVILADLEGVSLSWKDHAVLDRHNDPLLIVEEDTGEPGIADRTVELLKVHLSGP